MGRCRRLVSRIWVHGTASEFDSGFAGHSAVNLLHEYRKTFLSGAVTARFLINIHCALMRYGRLNGDGAGSSGLLSAIDSRGKIRAGYQQDLSEWTYELDSQYCAVLCAARSGRLIVTGLNCTLGQSALRPDKTKPRPGTVFLN